MQGLENLTRGELLQLVRTLEQRLEKVENGIAAARRAPIELDFVCAQALQVLDNSGVPAFVYDTTGGFRLLAANECMAALSGYTREELLALGLMSLLAHEEREGVRRLLELPRQGGFSSSGGWRHRTKLGEIREIEASGYDLVFKSRQARFVIVQDVTRRKREALLQQRLASIVEHSSDCIISTTVEGTVLSWNRAAERLFGYTAAEIVWRSVEVLWPAEIAEQERARLRPRVLAGEHFDCKETVRVAKHGERIEVSVSAAPLRDASGVIVGISSILRDIRLQKQQERLVLEGDQRLKLALESAGLSLWDWDIPGSQVHYDDAFARLLGYGPGELPLASSLWEGLAHPDDAALVAERIDCHLRDLCDFCELELRVRARAGDWVWISARGRVVARDRAGEPLRMMGTSQDISVRKREEHTSQMLSAFLASSEDSIISRALDGTVLSWNRGAERILGYTAAEMVGRNILAIYPEDRTAEMGWINERVRAGQTVSHLETTRRHKDGRSVQLALTAAPMRDAEGRVIGTASIGYDITQRSREEAARSLLVAVAESSQDAIYSHDRDGKILSWNRGAEEIFGYAAVEAIGQDSRILAVQAPEQLAEHQDRVLRGERVAPFELAARRKTGEAVLASVSAAPLRDDEGHIVGVAAVAREIGTQKRLELLTARTQAIGHVGGWELDCRSARLFWTDEMYRIQDLSPEQFSPSVERATAMYTPEAIPVIREAIHCAVELGEHFDLELPLITARGRQRWVRIIGEAQREDGRVTHVYGAMQDITARRKTEDALRDSERQLETILDNAAEGMLVLSPAGAIERFNREAQQIFGYDAAEAHALTLKQLILELGYDETGDSDCAPALMQRLVGSHREFTGRRKDGSMFPLELAVSEITIGPGAAKFTAIVRDITERKSWESRIYNLAYSDSLTGLPNRLLLRDRLEHAIATAQRNRSLVGVLFLDLDHFKAINDSFGHHVGDALLREIGERAKSCVREIDTVSRLGGDEFVVVLPELREGLDAGAVARKILAALSQPYRIDSLEITITPTLGISIYPEDGPDADALLRCADTAMYHAKESGKNRFQFFSPRPG